MFLLQLLSFRKELRPKRNYKGIQNPSTKHAPFSTKLVSSETNSLAVRRLALLDGKLSTAQPNSKSTTVFVTAGDEGRNARTF